MMKRILSLALAVLLALSLTAALAAPVFAEDYNGVTVDEWWGDFGIRYNTNQAFEGRVWLVAYRGSGGDIIIPDGVEAIKSKAFTDNTTITNVTIPYGVKEIIGAFAGCTSLISINIPDGVTELYSTFRNCKSRGYRGICTTVYLVCDSAFCV